MRADTPILIVPTKGQFVTRFSEQVKSYCEETRLIDDATERRLQEAVTTPPDTWDLDNSLSVSLLQEIMTWFYAKGIVPFSIELKHEDEQERLNHFVAHVTDDDIILISYTNSRKWKVGMLSADPNRQTVHYYDLNTPIAGRLIAAVPFQIIARGFARVLIEHKLADNFEELKGFDPEIWT